MPSIPRLTFTNGTLVDTQQAEVGQEFLNREALIVKAKQALATNTAYSAHAALPAAAALTTTQLTTIIRVLSAEVDALAKQNNALIRLVIGFLDDVSDT